MANMQFTMKLSFNNARLVREAIVNEVAQLKCTAQAKLSTEEERLDAGRRYLALEALLRAEYGDYEESETAPPVKEPLDIQVD